MIMKVALIIRTVFAVFLLVGKREALSQGTFANLDFEHPILPLVEGADGRVSISNAMPGWTGYLGGFPTDRVGYDTVAGGDAAISLHDSISLFFPPIQGDY